MKQGLDPIIDESSSVLILGTLPGEESLRLRQYYANPANQFWPILSRVYDEPLQAGYDARLALVKNKGLALWDVLRSAEREGSLDSAIRSEVANDFSALCEMFPRLHTIAFNGGKAQTLFQRHVARKTALPARRLQVLPSTSPTPGRNVLPFEQKLALWRAFLIASARP
ncbi:MAG: DNA-deoxyinosine glycosylase [Planctomycetota bacterium]